MRGVPLDRLSLCYTTVVSIQVCECLRAKVLRLCGLRHVNVALIAMSINPGDFSNYFRVGF